MHPQQRRELSLVRFIGSRQPITRYPPVVVIEITRLLLVSTSQEEDRKSSVALVEATCDRLNPFHARAKSGDRFSVVSQRAIRKELESKVRSIAECGTM